MKGLLNRLAARAAGTALAVRSDARLPFSGVGRVDEADRQTDPSGMVMVTEVAAAARPADMPSGDEPNTPRTQVGPMSPGPQVRPPARGEAPSVTGHRNAAAFAPLVREAAPLVADREGRMPAPVVDRRAGGPRSVLAVPALAAVELMRGAPLDRNASPVALEVAPALAPRGEPPRLMPAHAPPQEAATSPTAFAAAGMPARLAAPARAVAEEPTEVHVHIGRIDVTAARDAAPPRRRPVAAPAPMSLDAYLARRSRT